MAVTKTVKDTVKDTVKAAAVSSAATQVAQVVAKPDATLTQITTRLVLKSSITAAVAVGVVNAATADYLMTSPEVQLIATSVVTAVVMEAVSLAGILLRRYQKLKASLDAG